MISACKKVLRKDMYPLYWTSNKEGTYHDFEAYFVNTI